MKARRDRPGRKVDVGRSRVAVHEAGHVVAAVGVGVRVRRVLLLGTEGGTEGEVAVSGAGDHYRQLWVCLGGPQAEHLFCGDATDNGADLAAALAHAAALGDPRPAELVAHVAGRVSAELSEPGAWRAVLAVAKALFRRGSLGGRTAERIALRAWRRQSAAESQRATPPAGTMRPTREVRR